MHYICLDLEMSEVPFGKAPFWFRNEVIQIGAIILNDKFQLENEKDKFETFVYPTYSTITQNIFYLTGITDQMLVGAPEFEVAFEKYCEWIKTRIGNDEFITFCWNQKDYTQLRDELIMKADERKDLSKNLETFVDLQKTFSNILGTKISIGLETAVNFCHEEFKGKAHTAFVDAYNTATILNKICKSNHIKPKFVFLQKSEIEQNQEIEKAEKAEEEDLNNSFKSSFGAFFSKELLEEFDLKKENDKIQKEDFEKKKTDYSNYLTKAERRQLKRQEKMMKARSKLPIEMQKLVKRHHVSLQYEIPPRKWIMFFTHMMTYKSDVEK